MTDVASIRESFAWRTVKANRMLAGKARERYGARAGLFSRS